MKNTLTILVLALLCLTRTVEAQNKINLHPDSIRIEFPDQSLVVLELRDYKSQPQLVEHFPATVKDILSYVKRSTPNDFASSGPHRITVQYIPGQKEIIGTTTGISNKAEGKQHVTISPINNQSTSVTIKDKEIVELLPPGWELVITSKEYNATVYADSYESLEAITTQDFAAIVNKLNTDPQLKAIGRKSIRSRMVIKDGKVEQSTFSYVFPGDNIILSANAGVGVVRSVLYPELTFLIGLRFRDRFGKQNIRTTLSLNNMFFADRTTEGFTSHVNSFLSVSIEKNFNLKGEAAHWAGFGVGYLVHRSGDYFIGKTAKFYFTNYLGSSRLTLTPELYFTNDFKKFTFGMTLKYAF